jgi:nicotinamidase-related amidase
MLALLPIDIQKGFLDPYWGIRNHPRAESAMEELIDYWRSRGWPIFHVQHLSVVPDSPLRPGQKGVEFMDFALPRTGEPVFQKQVNSGFIGTKLESALREKGIKKVVPLGFTTDHCVSTTTRMAANLGFEVDLSNEALATFDRCDYSGRRFDADTIHRTALASLHGEFATVYSQAELLTRVRNL